MENEELTQRVTALEHENGKLCRGMIATVTMITVVAGLWNLHQTLSISNFQEIFDQMLNGKALPAISTFVIGAAPYLVLTSIALPLTSIGISIFRSRKPSSLTLLGVILLVILAQFVITKIALWRPLYQIITEMSAG